MFLFDAIEYRCVSAVSQLFEGWHLEMIANHLLEMFGIDGTIESMAKELFEIFEWDQTCGTMIGRGQLELSIGREEDWFIFLKVFDETSVI